MFLCLDSFGASRGSWDVYDAEEEQVSPSQQEMTPSRSRFPNRFDNNAEWEEPQKQGWDKKLRNSFSSVPFSV